MAPEKKLRYSHQREKIYQYLVGSEEHPTAEQIYQDLRQTIPDLSLGTVYRNLKLLEELGKIKRVASLQEAERYDAHLGDHVHFVCECCGSICDIMDTDVNTICAAVSLGKNYQLLHLDLTLNGLCPQCANLSEK